MFKAYLRSSGRHVEEQRWPRVQAPPVLFVGGFLSLCSALTIVSSSTAWAAGLSDQPNQEEWRAIRSAAKAFVATETPKTAWPFTVANQEDLAASSRKVFAHYFTPLPISIDGRPAESDYYSVNYLERSGEGGKFSKVGGYLRDRPLPTSAIANHQWKYENAAIDVLRAHKIGADGFMVDLLQAGVGRYQDAVDVLFSAAAEVAPEFRLVLEPDMAAFMHEPVDTVANIILSYAQRQNVYRLQDGRLLVTPFAADLRDAHFWRELLAYLKAKGVSVALAPVLLDPNRASEFLDFSYGLSEWGPRDPNDVPRQLEGIVSRMHALKRIWIMPIAPQDARPKSSFFWESRNTELYRELWQNAIEQGADGVQLITWNDYSESTQVEPSAGTQFIFYDLAAYYISWFKTGKEPLITTDGLFYTQRRQLIRGEQTAVDGDTPMRLMGDTSIENMIEVITFLTKPATLEFKIGRKVTLMEIQSGLRVTKFYASPGRPIFSLLRDGHVLIRKVSDWDIEAVPARDNLTYVGGSSTRNFGTSSPALLKPD